MEGTGESQANACAKNWVTLSVLFTLRVKLKYLVQTCCLPLTSRHFFPKLVEAVFILHAFLVIDLFLSAFLSENLIALCFFKNKHIECHNLSIIIKMSSIQCICNMSQLITECIFHMINESLWNIPLSGQLFKRWQKIATNYSH